MILAHDEEYLSAAWNGTSIKKKEMVCLCARVIDHEFYFKCDMESEKKLKNKRKKESKEKSVNWINAQNIRRMNNMPELTIKVKVIWITNAHWMGVIYLPLISRIYRLTWIHGNRKVIIITVRMGERDTKRYKANIECIIR